MPIYRYKAKRGPTEIIEGEVTAASEDDAFHSLSNQGLLPIKIKPVTLAEQVDRSRKSDKARSKNKIEATTKKEGDDAAKSKIRISHRDLNIFTRQFSILLKAKVPLLRSFEVLSAQTENVKFQSVLAAMQSSLKEGGSLSEVLAEYPRIFSQIFVSMIHAGELTGTLDKVLMRLSEFSERESEVRSKVQSALIYPFFLLLMGVGTIFVLLTFVMPRLMVVFGDLGTELPKVTQFVMSISTFCQHYWIWIVGTIGFIVVWFRTRGISKSQRRLIDALVLKIPVLKDMVEKSEIARFLRSMELLYENGIALYQAVEVGMQTISNQIIRDEFERVPSLLEGGETLANSLSEVSYISNFVTNMVSVGEESGQLGSAVGETALFYEQETSQFIKVMTSLLEPLMILSVGLIVGFIVIAMLLPIFEIHTIAS